MKITFVALLGLIASIAVPQSRSDEPLTGLWRGLYQFKRGLGRMRDNAMALPKSKRTVSQYMATFARIGNEFKGLIGFGKRST